MSGPTPLGTSQATGLRVRAAPWCKASTAACIAVAEQRCAMTRRTAAVVAARLMTSSEATEFVAQQTPLPGNRHNPDQADSAARLTSIADGTWSSRDRQAVAVWNGSEWDPATSA